VLLQFNIRSNSTRVLEGTRLWIFALSEEHRDFRHWHLCFGQRPYRPAFRPEGEKGKRSPKNTPFWPQNCRACFGGLYVSEDVGRLRIGPGWTRRLSVRGCSAWPARRRGRFYRIHNMCAKMLDSFCQCAAQKARIMPNILSMNTVLSYLLTGEPALMRPALKTKCERTNGRATAELDKSVQSRAGGVFDAYSCSRWVRPRRNDGAGGCCPLSMLKNGTEGLVIWRAEDKLGLGAASRRPLGSSLTNLQHSAGNLV